MTQVRQITSRVMVAVVLASTLFTLLALTLPSPASALESRSVLPVPSNCATTLVTLHGSQAPTITCLKQKSGTSGIHPLTSTENCMYGYYTVTLEVSSDQGLICFDGTGYLGYHLTHIGYIGGGSYGWMRIYPSGSSNGYFWNFSLGEQVSGGSPADGNHDATQVCPGCGYHS